jgi:hypothetical protein
MPLRTCELSEQDAREPSITSFVRRYVVDTLMNHVVYIVPLDL